MDETASDKGSACSRGSGSDSGDDHASVAERAQKRRVMIIAAAVAAFVCVVSMQISKRQKKKAVRMARLRVHSSLRVMGPEASSSCDRPSCVDGYKIVKLSNSPRKKTKRMSVPQQENLIPLSPGGSAIMLNKFVEKLVKQQSQPPQPPQPPRSLEEQTEIAGEKESVAQKKLEHAKKLAENEPKNPRLSADVETHQKLFDARHRQHMILVAKLAKQLEEELAAQLVDDSG